MSANMEWQRQQVKERVNGPLQEGLAHRKVYARTVGRTVGRKARFTFRAALAMGAVLFVLGVLMSG